MEYKEEPVSGLSLGELDPFGPAMFFFIVCIHIAIALLVIIPTNKTCDFHKLNLFVCISKNIYTINR